MQLFDALYQNVHSFIIGNMIDDLIIFLFLNAHFELGIILSINVGLNYDFDQLEFYVFNLFHFNPI